jgi:REP element-mobilizing transposase RayT
MLPERKKLPHGVPPWVEDGALYFITINCRDRGQNSLCQEEISKQLFESIAFRHQRREWWVRSFLLMPDHCHALMSFSRELSMAASIRNWKRFTARKLGIQWQRDFFDHRIRDLPSLQEKESYIKMNPVRKGLCKDPAEWIYFWVAFDFD